MQFLDRILEAFGHTTVEIGGDGVPFHLRRRRINISALFVEIGTLVIGGLISAVGINLFIAPFNIAPGGASGTAIILHHFIPTIPLGLTMLAINVPAYLLGFRSLGGGPFLARSLTATVVYNLGVDALGLFLPKSGLTDQMILNAVFGGVVTGIGSGLIYSVGGSAGAGGILNLLLNQRMGWPIKVNSMVSNSVVILFAGIVFGWAPAMYAVITFYVSGAVADFVLEGPDVIRTAIIITDQPEYVSSYLMEELHRGVTHWKVEGMHSRETHSALFCTIGRHQIRDLKNAVAWADPKAFVIIGPGHEALGKGFRRLKPEPRLVTDLDEEEAVSNDGHSDSIKTR